MKKIHKSSLAPAGLVSFLAEYPDAGWEQFRDETQAKLELESQLRADQRGICAYCENNLATYHGQGLDDFRVEHFHPKSSTDTTRNWALDWDNLLATCTGGNSKYIGDGSRFTSPDHSCDVPKENKIPTNKILNPCVDVPAFPPIFEFDEEGGMQVSEERCPANLLAIAKSTIENLRLNPLPSKKIATPRLKRFRKVLIGELGEQMEILLKEMSMQEAAQTLAEISFKASKECDWPALFSCIRWYLGPAAESRLREIGYTG